MTTGPVGTRPANSWDPSEPRRSSAAVPYALPKSDNRLSGYYGMAAMILAGAAMLTRFTIWPWLSFLAAIASVQSGRTLAPDENSGAWAGWSTVMMAFASFSSLYAPIFLGQAERVPWDTLPLTYMGGLKPIYTPDPIVAA